MPALAPREIVDYVYRSARVADCEAGIAGRIANNVCFAEIHYGGALVEFLDEWAAGSLVTSDFVWGPDAVMAIEIAFRRTSEHTFEFESPVRLAAIADTLWHTAKRGVSVAGLPHHDSTAGASISSVAISAQNPPASCVAGVSEAAAAAFGEGVAVDDLVYTRLVAAAAEFLIAEAVLDAAAPE